SNLASGKSSGRSRSIWKSCPSPTSAEKYDRWRVSRCCARPRSRAPTSSSVPRADRSAPATALNLLRKTNSRAMAIRVRVRSTRDDGGFIRGAHVAAPEHAIQHRISLERRAPLAAVRTTHERTNEPRNHERQPRTEHWGVPKYGGRRAASQYCPTGIVRRVTRTRARRARGDRPVMRPANAPGARRSAHPRNESRAARRLMTHGEMTFALCSMDGYPRHAPRG